MRLDHDVFDDSAGRIVTFAGKIEKRDRETRPLVDSESRRRVSAFKLLKRQKNIMKKSAANEIRKIDENESDVPKSSKTLVDCQKSKRRRIKPPLITYSSDDDPNIFNVKSREENKNGHNNVNERKKKKLRKKECAKISESSDDTIIFVKETHPGSNKKRKRLTAVDSCSSSSGIFQFESDDSSSAKETGRKYTGKYPMNGKSIFLYDDSSDGSSIFENEVYPNSDDNKELAELCAKRKSVKISNASKTMKSVKKKNESAVDKRFNSVISSKKTSKQTEEIKESKENRDTRSNENSKPTKPSISSIITILPKGDSGKKAVKMDSKELVMKKKVKPPKRTNLTSMDQKNDMKSLKKPLNIQTVDGQKLFVDDDDSDGGNNKAATAIETKKTNTDKECCDKNLETSSNLIKSHRPCTIVDSSTDSDVICLSSDDNFDNDGRNKEIRIQVAKERNSGKILQDGDSRKMQIEIKSSSENNRIADDTFDRDRDDDDDDKDETDERTRAKIQRLYFESVFPYDEIVRWLTYGNSIELKNREFSFIKGGVFIRHESFLGAQAMKLYFTRNLPAQITIGSQYNANPAINESIIDLEAVQRELIFDIDLNDYNDVRSCCTGKDICSKCWQFAVVACKILDKILREDFDWQLILWSFSGRRGVHCWVCDWSARTLSGEDREKIVKLMQQKQFRITGSCRFNLQAKPLNHQLRRAFDILAPKFVSICLEQQNIFGTPEGVEIFFRLLPSGSFQDFVRDSVQRYVTSVQRWNNFLSIWEYHEKTKSPTWIERPHLVAEIIFFYMYPRLDVGVTTDIKHVIKCPFSWHPTSMKLCIPFDPKQVDEFEISKVPSIHHFAERSVKALDPETNTKKSEQLEVFLKSRRVLEKFVELAEKSPFAREPKY